MNRRFCAVSGPSIELVLDQPVTETLQVAVAIPRVIVSLKPIKKIDISTVQKYFTYGVL